MTKTVGEIDNSLLQLLKETYRQVKPSPAFKRRLYEQLVQELRARQQPVGPLDRIRRFLAGLAATGSLWWRRSPAISIVVAVALLLLVVGGVLAALGGIDGLRRRERAPEHQVPTTIVLPTAERPTPLTPTLAQPERREPPTLGATPAEPEQPALPPSLTAVPTATRAPTSTSTPVPTPTRLPTHTSTSVPTATMSPTATSIPVVEITNSPTPAQAEATKALPSPTVTACQLGRIMGVAWVDANGNGRRDESDPLLSGVMVTLHTGGRLIATVSTGGDGQYVFSNLAAGIYRVQAAPPAGYEAITAQAWDMDLVCATIRQDLGYQHQPDE